MAIIVTLELCNRIFFFVFRSLSHNNKFNCVKCQMFTDLWSLGLNLSCNYLKKTYCSFTHIHTFTNGSLVTQTRLPKHTIEKWIRQFHNFFCKTINCFPCTIIISCSTWNSSFFPLFLSFLLQFITFLSLEFFFFSPKISQHSIHFHK